MCEFAEIISTSCLHQGMEYKDYSYLFDRNVNHPWLRAVYDGRRDIVLVTSYSRKHRRTGNVSNWYLNLFVCTEYTRYCKEGIQKKKITSKHAFSQQKYISC